MRAIPYAAFFLSGASSLIFQALWTRMLHHTFGATSVAMSTVLTAFMGGLGFGAYLFGRRAARFRRPLVVYALAELGVAACALLIPPLVRSDGFFALVNAALRQSLGEGSFAFMLARFFCVLPLLLVPTTLMGGTLPLLAQHFVAGDGQGRSSARVGALYALNTFGAVAGTVLSSFVLMPSIGVRATNLVAVAINALLGLTILLLARAAPTALEPARPTPSAAALPADSGRRRLALFAFGVSGACSMAYEVVWSRALAMAIGSSLQSFALILVTFLIGIAGGSAVAAHLLGSARSAGLLALAGLSAVLTLLALAPALVLSNPALALLVLALLTVGLALYAQNTLAHARDLVWSDEASASEAERLLGRAGLYTLLVPCVTTLLELARFTWFTGAASVAHHGYLPYVTSAAVLACTGCLALLSALRRAPLLLAGGVQLAIALATFTSYLFQDEIPYSFARLVTAVHDLPNHVGTVRFFMLLAAGLCTLPAALGMGAMFPITLELWSARGSAVGADVGRVYAANTVGSILGAWLPGFVLLPLWGMERTLASGMIINALIALALLQAARTEGASRHGRRALATAALALVLGLIVHLALPRSPLSWNLSHMTLGAFRVSLAHEVLDPESWGQPDLVYYRDGVSTTVSVERWGRHLSLKNNGKVDASNGDDMPTQIMVAAYPLLLHPRGPKDLEVAIVGFGSGVTVGAALEFPVRHVDAMELEEAVVDAALRFFSDVSHLTKSLERFPFVRHPRLTLFNDDGRNFLAATPKRYDVIISEPSNPWITGVSDLFTVDHFRVTKQRLKPGGVYCQWVQLYELSPENIKTVYATFASQFRYVLAFSAEELSSDTILVGSDSPLPIDLAHVARSLTNPRIADELERAYIHSPHDVWSRILFANRREIEQFAQSEWRRERGAMKEVLRSSGAEPCRAPDCLRKPVERNTDDNMLVELRAPSDLIGFARYEGYLRLFYGASWPYGQLPVHLARVDGVRANLDMALSLLAHGRRAGARAFAERAQRDVGERSREEAVDAQTIALLLGDEPEPELTLEPPVPSLPLSSAQRRAFDQHYTDAEQAFARGAYAAAADALERLALPLRTLSGPSLRVRYALALLRSSGEDVGRIKRAVLELEELIRRDETYTSVHPELYYFLARALDQARSHDKAVRNMRAYANLCLPP